MVIAGGGIADELGKAAGDVFRVDQGNAQAFGILPQLSADAAFELLPPLQSAFGKGEANDGMALVPVPMIGEVQARAIGGLGLGAQGNCRLAALKEYPVAGKGLGQGIEKERLAEAARAREKVHAATLGQLGNQGGFVDVVAVFLA